MYRHRRAGQQEAGQDSDTDTNTDGEKEPLHPEEDGEEDIFLDEGESDDERIRKIVKMELIAFRRERFSNINSTTAKLSWLKDNQAGFPTVACLARQSLGIPPIQVENERVFSLAGRIAAPLRNRISTNLGSNLVAIARNHSGFDDVEQGSTIAVTSMEEFSHYFLHQKEVEENEDGSMLEI